MFQKIVPFNIQVHGRKKIKPLDNFMFASNAHIAPLMINEFTRAASAYPIVFLKNEHEKFGIYALLGLNQGQNLFVDGSGRWDAPYIPAMIRRYPFSLGQGQGENQFMVCIDEASSLFSDTEGEPLADASGQPGQIIHQAKEYLTELYRLNTLTEKFCQDMERQNLLTPLNMQVKDQNGQIMQNIAGCFAVEEKRLDQLSDAAFLELRKKSALSLIYAHIMSLTNVEALVKTHRQRNA